MLGAARSFFRSRTSEPILSESRLELFAYTPVAGGGQHKGIVYYPPGYVGSLNYYPVIYFYGGDGSDGTFTQVTNQALSNMGSNTYQATLSNTGSRKVLYSSVIIKRAGVEVARIKPKRDGSNTCEVYHTDGPLDKSGSCNVDSASATLTITFSGSIGADAVTVDYAHSALFEAGIPRFLNRGSEELPAVVIAVQKVANDSDYLVTSHWDDLLTDVEVGLSLRVLTNRRYVCGISRGGFFTWVLLRDRYTQIAAVMVVAANTPSSLVWANYQTIGNLWIGGNLEASQDAITPGIHSVTSGSGGNANTNNPEHSPNSILIEGLAHTTALWDTSVYNRPTALFDYWEWMRRFSKDQNERCVLHVEWAEDNPHYLNYREAKRVVDLLPAGSTKTDLLARLATLRTNILGSKRVWILDFGTTTPTSGQGAVLQNSAATGAVKSNMVDDLGAASGVGFTVVQEMSTTPTTPVRVVDSIHNAGHYHGFDKTVNRDGARLEPAVTNGAIKWTGLDPLRTYDQIVISQTNVSSTTYHTELPKCRVTPVGETGKTIFSSYNNFLHIEHNGLIPNGSNEIQSAVTNPGNFNSFLNFVILIG